MWQWVLIWILTGSVSMNLLWIFRESEKYTMESMTRGFYFGLILGPLAFVHLATSLYLKKKHDKEH